MANPANRAEEQKIDYKLGIEHLNKRIQSSSLTVMALAVGIVTPMVIDHSNNNKGSMHLPTVLAAYFTFVSGLSLCGLVWEILSDEPGPRRYIAIKALIHICAALLVFLAFSLSLMMQMDAVVTSLTLTGAMALIFHRLHQCVRTELKADIEAYAGCEAELQQLLELSTSITSILFGGWFGMAYFYFQNHPGKAWNAQFLYSEYLTFFTSVAASLMLLKAVPRTLAPCLIPVMEFKVLVWLLFLGVMSTAAVITVSKVGKYAVLAFVPEAAGLTACLLEWMRDKCALPFEWPWWLGSGDLREPVSHGYISVALTVLLSVVTYRTKDGGMASMYDEAFVLIATAGVVAALSWRLVTQQPTANPGLAKGLKVAARILAFSTFCLLVFSALAFLGVMFGGYS